MADSSFENSRTSFPRRVPNDTSVINYNQLRSDSIFPDIGIQRVTVETEPEYAFLALYRRERAVAGWSPDSNPSRIRAFFVGFQFL